MSFKSCSKRLLRFCGTHEDFQNKKNHSIRGQVFAIGLFESAITASSFSLKNILSSSASVFCSNKCSRYLVVRAKSIIPPILEA